MRARPLFILCTALAAAVACGDPTSPATRRLAGTYEAAATPATNSNLGTLTFTTTQGGVTTDWLAEGAFVHLTLRERLEGEEVLDDVAVRVVLDRAP
jgi:hypothetical protein